MSQWDPNDPNNPYNQQQQGWHGQQGGQGQQQGQQWQQPQQGQPQQQWQQDQQGQQQQWQQQQQGQQQWQQPQQGQQPWEQQQQQGQQQWQQPQQGQQQPWQQQQQQYDPNAQQQQWQQHPQGQSWEQQQTGAAALDPNSFGAQQQAAYQGAAHGNQQYQEAYQETYGQPSGRSIPGAIATLGVNERVAFIRRTYAHLFGAIVLFIGLEFALLHSASPLFKLITVPFNNLVFGSSQYMWLAVLAAFVAVGWVAEKWAMSATSLKKQYLGLGIYVLAEAIIFIPLLTIAMYYSAKAGAKINIIPVAAIITLALFAGLTLTVFITKKDFSFLRGALMMGSFAAMGIIVAAIMFGFDLGIVFSGAMILLAGGYVLYYTSRVLQHYRPTQHVAAALALFSALALMFWYVVRVLIELSGSD